MLEKIVNEKLLEARAVFGFWPANQINDDDIVVFADEKRTKTLKHLHHLRQQTDKPSGKANFSLADFVAPLSSDKADYIGGFVVTVGINADEIAEAYEQAGDDYNSIMVKALADRLAEAFAEHLHQRVRTEYWGYDENRRTQPRRNHQRKNTAVFAPPPATLPAPTILKNTRSLSCWMPQIK